MRLRENYNSMAERGGGDSYTKYQNKEIKKRKENLSEEGETF